jgi:DNA-binding transcriptional MerR regulator
MARRTPLRTSAARRRHPTGAGSAALFLSREVLCELGGVSLEQLTVWEREELLAPARVAEVRGHAEPLYDRAALRRIRLIRTLAEDLEVNLPGIGIILHLLEQLGR